VNTYLNSFDSFVDDIVESDLNLLKGELDVLLMQDIFNSIELENLRKDSNDDNLYIAA